MVEREQGRGHRDDEPEVGHTIVPSEGLIEVETASGDEAKARNAGFLAALDKVMADHHNVLAALAK